MYDINGEEMYRKFQCEGLCKMTNHSEMQTAEGFNMTINEK